MLIPILLGLLGAAILLLLFQKYNLTAQVKIWGQALVIAAFIYVGFNVYGQAWELLPIELLGVVAYGGLAFLAWKYHPAWLALGWLLHLGWDMGVHPLEGADYVPGWYPAACLGFDLAIGAYLFWLIRKEGLKIQVE